MLHWPLTFLDDGSAELSLDERQHLQVGASSVRVPRTWIKHLAKSKRKMQMSNRRLLFTYFGNFLRVANWRRETLQFNKIWWVLVRKNVSKPKEVEIIQLTFFYSIPIIITRKENSNLFATYKNKEYNKTILSWPFLSSRNNLWNSMPK